MQSIAIVLCFLGLFFTLHRGCCLKTTTVNIFEIVLDENGTLEVDNDGQVQDEVTELQRQKQQQTPSLKLIV